MLTLILLWCTINFRSRQSIREDDTDSTKQQFNNPAYGVKSTQTSNEYSSTPPPPDTVQEHGYETVNFTRPAKGQSATNQAESPQKNDHEYDRLDRSQKEHKTVATSESPEQNDQHKTSSKGTEGSEELNSAYSRLENQKSNSKKDSEEHIYYVLEGPSS